MTADPIFDAAVSILLWVVFSLYLSGDLYWIYEIGVYGWPYSPPSRQWGAKDIQVRILTIGNEAVVRETVQHLPSAFDEIFVITETAIDVPDAKVRVVPTDFESKAINKGRALEWARQTLPIDREYILYLDEDSHVVEFNGLPDADIVQFNEHPRKTNSWLTYFCEINRIGFQTEQRAFPSVKIPLYAWGGGLAVRTAVEDAVTWEYQTVIEDTVFAWRAFNVLDEGPSFAFIPDRISNQAPPTIFDMLQQRRRWIAGSREDNDLLSIDRVLMYGIRDLSWSITGVIPVLAVVSLFSGGEIIFGDLFRIGSIVLFSFMFVWIALGVIHYRPHPAIGIAVIVLAPITTVLHSIGAFWGLVSQPDTFKVTTKVSDGGSGNDP